MIDFLELVALSGASEGVKSVFVYARNAVNYDVAVTKRNAAKSGREFLAL